MVILRKRAVFSLISWYAVTLPFCSQILFAPALKADDQKSTLTVPAAETTTFLSTNLPDGDGLDPSCDYQLIELDNTQKGIMFQLVPAMNQTGLMADKKCQLLAMIPPRSGSVASRRFHIAPLHTDRNIQSNRFRFEVVDNKMLRLYEGEQSVLQYNYGVITSDYVPKNDPLHWWANYIHPLWGLNGEILTDDFPKDHPNHHGIYWAWPQVIVNNKKCDLWSHQNIHQRFVKWICRESGPIGAVIGVENGWFVDNAKVMIERVWLQVYRATEDGRALDIAITLIPTKNPVTIKGREHRGYGGLVVRFKVENPDDVVISTQNGTIKGDQVIAISVIHGQILQQSILIHRAQVEQPCLYIHNIPIIHCFGCLDIMVRFA